MPNNTGPKRTLIVGNQANGGMATVANILLGSKLANSVDYQKSYIEASSLVNWTRFLFYYIFVYTFTLITRKDIKIVHILCADRGSVLRKAILQFIAKIFKKKTIINIHSCDEDLFYNDSLWPFSVVTGYLLNNADMILVLSERWKTVIESKCSNPDIRILYNPIIIKEQVFYNSNPANFIFMGRLGKRKGAYDLIEAAKHLKDSGIKINMYGDGEVKEIKDLVIKNGLENTVNVAGWISGAKVQDAYRNSDVFILPSYDEGLPMSILEAMSFGLPVISTLVGGIPEQIEDNSNGYLIEPGNIEQMVSRIKMLAEDTELRKKMGSKSYQIAREKFNVDTIADKLIKIYNELLK